MLKKLLIILIMAISHFSQAQGISGGSVHSLFLCPDGTVKGVGANHFGQLGIGNKICQKLPTTVTGLSGITAVHSGAEKSLFLKNDGTVWACGKNIFGELGIGNNNHQSTPMQITSLSGITAISGFTSSLFLKNDGTVWACGDNGAGQLGIGNTVPQNTPVQITSLSGIIAISNGGGHSLFLKNDGTVWACGGNYTGSLGIGNTTDQLIPIQITSLSGITAIVACASHSLFLKNNGTVWVCGDKDSGNLGIGNTTSQNTPVQITSLSGITAISGYNNSLFLKNDGTVWACGSNYYGNLGIGNNSDKNTPVQITSLSGITAISAGSTHSLFLKNDGTVWSCGTNKYGELGDGTTTNKNTPVNLGAICPIPAPPTVNFSNFPSSLCLGGSVNTEPNIAGSNPQVGSNIDNSINVTAPKAIAKNSTSVFVLEGTDAIKRFNFDGVLQYTYNSPATISDIKSMAIGENDTIFVNNGDGNLYKFFPGGGSNLIPSVYLGFDPPMCMLNVPNNVLSESLIISDSVVASPLIMNTNSTNINTNTQYFDTRGFSEGVITSLSVDGKEHPSKRLLLAAPYQNKLWSRSFYDINLPNAKLLVDSNSTANMAFDFIDADTINDIICVSSRSTKKLGVIRSIPTTDNSFVSYLDTTLSSLINAQLPVGMVSASNTSAPKFWIADKAQGKLIRAELFLYAITPALPAGLKFDPLTGKVTGTPLAASAPQTYSVTIFNQLGPNTNTFTFGVTPASPLTNTSGSSTSSNQHDDGLAIKYYNLNNCEPLIELADEIGGTSPGQTQISQTVYPLVSVIANDTLIRRVNSIRAENQDALTVNVKLFYSYQDINLFNQTRGSALLSNDTIAGSMNMAVLQMHDKPDGSKEPIVHSPIAALWSNTNHYWVATVPVTKFSEFYGSDLGTLNTFDCTNTGSQTLTVGNNYYVWNNDTLFTQGIHTDTLINNAGCDSIVTLNLTFQTNGLSELANVEGVTIYPNPNNGIIYIKISNSSVKPKSIKVIDLMGKEVYNNKTNSNQIDLTELQSGVYFIFLETTENTVIRRIIKN